MLAAKVASGVGNVRHVKLDGIRRTGRLRKGTALQVGARGCQGFTLNKAACATSSFRWYFKGYPHSYQGPDEQ